ncbi:MAG: hypothetical protein KDA96_00585 [Planctomycetaceae bacterium]|nr:hypothetical protein [Planctomycetaceae bacterium]
MGAGVSSSASNLWIRDQTEINDIVQRYRATFSGSHPKHSLLRDFVFEMVVRMPYRLRGFGLNPVLFLRDCGSDDLKAVRNRIAAARQSQSILIAVALDARASEALWELRETNQTAMVVLSLSDYHSVLQARSPKDELRRRILLQVPYESLVPFTTSIPAAGPTFVGRQSEINRLVHGNQDYALCGPGGVGKSSLLRQVQWMLRINDPERYGRLVEVDLLGISDPQAAANIIAKRVHPDSRAQDVTLKSLEPFLRRIRHGDERFRNGPILLQLDEVGSLLEVDSHMTVSQYAHDYPGRLDDNCRNDSAFPLMQILRLARMEGLIELMISSRTETRMMLEHPENPFAVDAVRDSRNCSRLKLMEIQPLSNAEAQDLLLGPLADLGCDLRRHGNRLGDVLRQCQGIPFHLADAGLELAEELRPA